MRILFSIWRVARFDAFLLGIGGMINEGKNFLSASRSQTKSLYLLPTHQLTPEVVT